MKTKILGGIVALIFIAMVATGAFAMPFGGKWFSGENVQNAIENKDYETWKSAISEQLSEDNFNKIVERHGKREGFRETRQAARNALEEGDYEGWREAILSCENLPEDFEIPSEEDFNKLVELHQARMAQHQEMMELREKLGLPQHRGFGKFGSRASIE